MRPLPKVTCSRCGYQLEGVHIKTTDDTGELTRVAHWRAVCPECGHDNFGLPQRRRSWASLPLAVRVVLMAAMLSVLLLAAATLLSLR